MKHLIADISGYGINKINRVFWYWKPKLALIALNKNFELEIHKYVIIEFTVSEDIVDAIGGVGIEVKPE